MKKTIKRLIALVSACAILLVGCGKKVPTVSASENLINLPEEKIEETLEIVSETISSDIVSEVTDGTEQVGDSGVIYEEVIPEFYGLNDPELLQYIEDSTYVSLVNEFDSEDYIIEDVEAIYISQEYIDELVYNSKNNIWFGYTLEEVESRFEGVPYVFALGDDGKTVVKEFEKYDDTFEKILKNVAIGTGVILVCVTVSVVSGGAGAPVVSMIFASAAKTGTIVALENAAIGGVFSGAVTGIQTKDWDEALKAAALGASDGYKWGAIFGAVSGGVSGGVRFAEEVANEEARILAIDEEMLKTSDEWRKAELRALKAYGGSEQMSYLAGEEVELFTQGATRPDIVRFIDGHLEAIEVKYYNLESSSSLNTLYKELEREISSRIINMPSGTTQRIVLDVTERGFSEATVNAVKETIWTRLADIYPNIPIDVIGL